MGRVLYFHHYFPALMYIVMLGGKGEGGMEGGEGGREGRKGRGKGGREGRKGRKETERQVGISDH